MRLSLKHNLLIGLIILVHKLDLASCSDRSPGRDGRSVINPKFRLKVKHALDIKKKRTCNEYFYNKTGNVDTFIARQGYCFNLVGSNKELIWVGTDPNYGEKVTVVVKDKKKKTKTVTIELSSGNIKVFHRDGKGQPWIEQQVKSDDTEGESSDQSKEKHPERLLYDRLYDLSNKIPVCKETTEFKSSTHTLSTSVFLLLSANKEDKEELKNKFEEVLKNFDKFKEDFEKLDIEIKCMLRTEFDIVLKKFNALKESLKDN